MSKRAQRYGDNFERATNEELIAIAGDLKKHFDSWQNIVMGIGDTSKDRRLSTRPDEPISLTSKELEYLFAGNALARRVCEAPAKAAFQSWLTIASDETEDLDKKFQDRCDELSLKSELIKARCFARLHGGIALFMGADDGQDAITPLNEDKINTLDWVKMYNCHEILPVRWYNDPNKAKHMDPEIYEFRSIETPGGVSTATGMKVHESRLIRFDGCLTTRARQAELNGWSDSIFTATYPTLRAYGHAMVGAETIMTEFMQSVYKLKNLAGVISSKGADSIKARVQVINLMRSLLGAMIVDSEGEDFTRTGAPVAGLAELWDRFERMVCAAFGMPATILFGRSAAGMDATGEGDERTWLNNVANDRALDDEPGVEKLARLILKSKNGPTAGVEPKSWRITWNPLWKMSRQEELDCHVKQSTVDHQMITDQMIDSQEAATSRVGGTEYNYNTKLDMEARKAIAEAKPEPTSQPDAAAIALAAAQAQANKQVEQQVPAPAPKAA